MVTASMPDVKKSSSRGTLRLHTAPDVKTSRVAEKQKQKQEVLNSWIDRVSASDLLGVSITTLYEWEREGKLHPQKRQQRTRDNRVRWVIVYDPTELAQMPRYTKVAPRTRGEIAALAFDLFREGTPLDVVTSELREEPDVVIGLYERWLDMSRARHVISRELWSDFEAVVGEFDAVTTLLVRVRELAAKVPRDPNP